MEHLHVSETLFDSLDSTPGIRPGDLRTDHVGQLEVIAKLTVRVGYPRQQEHLLSPVNRRLITHRETAAESRVTRKKLDLIDSGRVSRA